MAVREDEAGPGAGGARERGAARMRGRIRVRRVLVPVLCAVGSAVVLAATVMWRVRPAAITVGQRTVILQPMPDPVQHTNLMVHEAVHREQFERIGFVRFVFRYLTDLDSRLRWESEAIATNLCRARAIGMYRVDALSAFYAAELERYHPFGELTEARGQRYLDRAYRGGAACATLLRRLITASPELADVPGVGAPPGVAAAP